MTHVGSGQWLKFQTWSHGSHIKFNKVVESTVNTSLRRTALTKVNDLAVVLDIGSILKAVDEWRLAVANTKGSGRVARKLVQHG